jgi:hypothetical protein
MSEVDHGRMTVCRTKNTSTELTPVPLCPPQTPYELTWDERA